MIHVLNKKTRGDLRNCWFPVEYIGRPTVLGNPFSHLSLPGLTRVGTREEAVHRYRLWLREQWKLNSTVKRELMRLVQLYRDTGELGLECWCAPLACHGDILKEAIEKIIAATRNRNR